ncbi:MAG: helix-turn-helix transcriptional regulator [Hyphomicrobiaceae bacterium]|nr:helix-turn-helix transcriptional regulator [Hyphomicrobiaceae bacterium]MCC0023195.1 helix-turn-helix transcriptional regulator [Hyphomicrobiaceae bacterium]
MLKLEDDCETDCPVARTAEIISGKWTTLIVRDLLSGTKRYSQLQRSLAGISPRMLAERLNMLVDQGLVDKTIFPTVPPKTEYTLTARGWALEPVIAAMAAFGEEQIRRESA